MNTLLTATATGLRVSLLTQPVEMAYTRVSENQGSADELFEVLWKYIIHKHRAYARSRRLSLRP